MSSKWIPKAHQPRSVEEKRLIGCKAYPTTGVMPGAPLAWCLRAQGDWCGDCKWKSKGTGK